MHSHATQFYSYHSPIDQMFHSILRLPDLASLQYIVTHVFCPLQLPDKGDESVLSDHSLAAAVTAVSRLYSDYVDEANRARWYRISRMLENLQASVQLENLDESQTFSQLTSMDAGDILTFLIRAQNAAVLFRKSQDVTLFESFEVSPKAGSVMTTPGKLICSYPGPAIEIPNAVFENKSFLSGLTNFLVRMNVDVLDSTPTIRKANSVLIENRDTTDPRYITELLTGIMRGVGSPANVVRITKRVGDDVVWKNSKLPWRRSSLWLLIKVAIQITMDQSTPADGIYKRFMLFFMCCLANDKLAFDLPNDLLQFMSAKISRRLRKLGSLAPDWLTRVALQTCTSCRSILEKRWNQVQVSQRVSPLWTPAQLDLIRDIELSLSSCSKYLRRATANHSINALDARSKLQFEHRARGSLNDFLSFEGIFFEEAYAIEPHDTLYDVERTVEQDIDAWVDRATDSGRACEALEILAAQYSYHALEIYGGNPELLSVMLLTMVELWIALDKIAIKAIPILADYSPEIPTCLLEQLLLSRSGHLRRLERAHQYLSGRHSRCRPGWSVFSPLVTADSFAVRYCRSSTHLRHLKAQIEEAARLDRSAKIAELERANAIHAELIERASQLDHDLTINQQGSICHADHCDKCTVERRCKKMRISVHEWPLPTDQLYADTVVFELDCPVPFDMWRTATIHLLVDLCSPPIDQKQPYIQLDMYIALLPFFVQHPRSRTTLASDAKPFAVSHYSKTSVPATEEAVCVNNGLIFYGFDCYARILVSQVSGPVDIQWYCTYELQSGSYQNLQKYIDTTSHASNEVLANQVECHQNLSIYEYTAFGHLRSGDLLQWFNILRELHGRSLTFSRYEVHFLFAQAASQVGPLDETKLRWHQELQRPEFGNALLGEMESLVRDVEANWQEGVTMNTISFLLRRLLASNPDHTVSLKALELLHTVRSKVFRWVKELSTKLLQTPGDEELRGLLRDAAITCRGTFDVDSSTVRNLLRSPENINTLLSCAILIHDHTPSDTSHLPVYSRLLLDRDRRLSLALEHVVSDLIQADSSDEGIDLAVGWVWPDYRPGSKWIPLPSPNSRWFWCSTASTNDQGSQTIHLNLLDGSLLVDGKQLARLPNEIVQHPLYNLIFGEQILDVVPSDLSRIDYATRGTISNHQVYFSLRNESDLVIRAKRKSITDESDMIELIPQDKLEGDLPAVLIEGHVHWLNLSTSVMEIRPFDSLWETSSENWRMDCTPGRYRMQKGEEYLVDIRSQSWNMVSRLLQPLDATQNLLVSVSPISANQPSMQLSVSLPRYGLSFYIDKDGDLQSHNMRGMVYDENQNIGTFFGLVDRLVLRPKIRDPDTAEAIPRRILIPDGEVSFQKDGHHVRVKINTPHRALERITYQAYEVDTDLGCLRGNVSLTNKLYCVYLHALTSGCGTDPLTGRTGTEEALSLLRSASCSSIMRFGSREGELLSLIASICPKRTWYPEHLKCMQRVEWHDLPASSQHQELYVASKVIKDHYETIQVFLENQPVTSFQNFPVHDDHLLRRSALRAAYLFSPELSSTTVKHDVPYDTARDLLAHPSGEQRAYSAATSVHNRTAYSATRKDTVLMLKSWKRSMPKTASFSLQYDRSWLAPELPTIWLQAYKTLQIIDEDEWFQLLFSLPAMAYASPNLSDLVPVFVAFARNPRFRPKDPPPHDSYDLTDGYSPSDTVLRKYISKCALSFKQSPEGREPAKKGEDPRSSKIRRRKLYRSRIDSDANATVRTLIDAWPCETPPQCSVDPALYRVGELAPKVQTHFSSCHRNLQLKEHFTEVQKILDDAYAQATPIPTFDSKYNFQPPFGTTSESSRTSCEWSILLSQLFTRPAPSLQEHTNLSPCTAADNRTSPPDSVPLDQLLVLAEANAEDTFQHRYVSALCTSASCFQRGSARRVREEATLPTASTLAAHYTWCRDSYTNNLQYIKQHLGPQSKSELAVAQSGQWPRITAHTLFRSLASNAPVALPTDWKRCLIRLALLVLELQRARRLLRLHLNDLREELRRELQDEACDGWDTEAHSDWLLVQLQSNFLIRRVQAEVATEMISPSLGSNTAMQLNMGEGKSSVIVPIVVTALANGTQLVRVIVPKALTAQMFHLLVDRLGGLVHRRIYFLPFSRSLEVDRQKVAILHKTMSECMKAGGILVVQPEHILSLKLVTVEKQLLHGVEEELAEPLLKLQQWLHSHSRDILDESDEILHVRYQMVYTIGLQRHMEGSPERWTTTGQVLGLVSKHARSLQKRFPLGVEYQSGPSGSFPHFRILHANAGRELISRIVQDVMDDRLPSFNFGQLRVALRDAIRSFISSEQVPPADAQLVKDYSQHTAVWGGLLLLRGLLATGILLYALRERRWRVDYGLAPTRTMLAVPYRAKDVPAQRAEFGHPDIAIVLTFLSYYYSGLSEEQLRLSFEILLRQEDPLADYGLWVADCPAVPENLRSFSGINIKSSEQWSQLLFPLFHRNRATVDFYLSNIVFPKEAKEFPAKLSCSGWDLAERKERLLTGFSGTNDGQYLLPLHITQRDPNHQRGTNAKVLSYILQRENKHYMCMSHENGERRTTSDFLRLLVAQQPEIRVLLDVGAQMLDLQNHALAEAWLSISANTSAAIYFDDDDELTVLAKDGTKCPFISSPFAQQLDQCVVYLDDAHTRGTDIQFPIGFRAAVTLGPKVTKDRLAQGSMRMRKLGDGHSLMFFAPLEIDRRIRSVARKGPRDDIYPLDILQWAIRETCEDIQQRTTHWAQQGIDHTSRYRAWTSFCAGERCTEALSDAWLQPEAKSLVDLYEPRTASHLSLAAHPDIQRHCVHLGVSSLRHVGMDEEQEREHEREVVHEAERERQVQRPPWVPPATPTIHPDVVFFVKKGVIPFMSTGFRRAVETLDGTSAAAHEPQVWSPYVLATVDYEKTVELDGMMDDYLRPVMWVVSGTIAKSPVLVIMSPHEVNTLLPHIRGNDRVHLHLYAPRTTKLMTPYDLALYSVPAVPAGWTPPSRLVDQLNLFAGQLYLKDYETYIRSCRFLCVYARDLDDEDGVEVGCDGFMSPNRRPPGGRHLQSDTTFQTSPLGPLRTLIGLRKKGMGFALTHMGKLLDGRLLSEADFEGS